MTVEHYLAYVGVRVTDLNRSLRVYGDVLGLEEVSRSDFAEYGLGKVVMMKDPFTGQKLELNWYPPGSKFGTPYEPGEGLDHVSFRVTDLSAVLSKLSEAGCALAGPEYPAEPAPNFRYAFVKDPDGNWIEIWESPEPMPRSPP